MTNTLKDLIDGGETHIIPHTVRLAIEPLESDMKPYYDTYYSSGLKTITTDEHIDLIVSRIDKYLATYSKELFILDDEDYENFFTVDETGYKAIVIEKDNYDILSDAGDGITSFKTPQLALLDLTTRLLLEKGN